MLNVKRCMGQNGGPFAGSGNSDAFAENKKSDG
jgi:hypothetical protein